MRLKEEIIAGVREIPGLEVVPDSMINIFVVYSPTLDLRPVSAELTDRGWMFVTNAEPGPVAICLCTMPQNEYSAGPFLADLRAAMSRAEPVPAGEAAREQAAYGNV
jgi:tyrosine decarboxylase/aspartate 1-decarboxylase